MDLEVLGLEDTIKAMEALPGLLGTQVYGDGMLAAAGVIAAEAKTTTAFMDDSGALRASIRARRRSSYVHTRSGPRKTARSAAQVVAAAPHAFIVEYGRAPGSGYPGAPPKPYLEPAVINTLGRQLSAAGGAMRTSFATLRVQLTSGRVSQRTTRLLAEDT